MGVFDAPDFDDHEQIVFCRDPDAGLAAIIAIHDTTMGSALGGCRMWPYPAEGDALADVLRLSRAMTFKHALAVTGRGGGKSVIIGEATGGRRSALLRAFGRFVETLGGRFIVAEDVGTSVEDMAEIRRVTRHVAGLVDGGSGDPSPVTAFGVHCGIKAAVRHKLGRNDLNGVSVAVQGLGHVGFALCRYLHESGACLEVSDIDATAVARAVEAFSAVAVAPESIIGRPVDVFAPCALGGALNETTIPRIQAPIVAGAANNQLQSESDGRLLFDRGILYAPDYAINAGGVINIAFEDAPYDQKRAMRRTETIHDTLMEIFRRADNQGMPTNAIADRMAHERIEAAKAQRTAAKSG